MLSAIHSFNKGSGTTSWTGASFLYSPSLVFVVNAPTSTSTLLVLLQAWAPAHASLLLVSLWGITSRVWGWFSTILPLWRRSWARNTLFLGFSCWWMGTRLAFLATLPLWRRRVLPISRGIIITSIPSRVTTPCITIGALSSKMTFFITLKTSSWASPSSSRSSPRPIIVSWRSTAPSISRLG